MSWAKILQKFWQFQFKKKHGIDQLFVSSSSEKATREAVVKPIDSLVVYIDVILSIFSFHTYPPLSTRVYYTGKSKK
jgi:hypothetical protein